MEALKKSQKKGFTLIEAAVALVILGIIAGIAIVLFPQTNSVQQDIANDKKLDKIQNAILAFYNANGYLPCPAPRAQAIDTASYGVAATCSAVSIPNTVVTDSGVGVNSVVIGVIPAKTLGLRDEDLLDSYGNQINYSVLKSLAQTQSMFNNYINSSPNLIVQDTNNNQMNLSGNLIAFVITSFGNNGLGAYNAAGGVVSACAGVSKDVENCNDDKIYRDQVKNFESGANYFDDGLRWMTINQLTTFGNGNNLSSSALNFQYAYLSVKEPSLSTITGAIINSAFTNGHGQWIAKLAPTNINYNSIDELTVNTAIGLVTIPPGTYYVKASAFQNFTHYGQLRLITSGGTVISTGIPQSSYTPNMSLNGGASEQVWSYSRRSYLADIITVTLPTSFYMQQYINSSGSIALVITATTAYSNLTEATPLHIDTLEILKIM
ncbi:MAG: prepilin-type N-terminal cleavage/methylation domain-containing protein [Rickettsiales bacterium]